MRISDWSSDVCSSDLLHTCQSSETDHMCFGDCPGIADVHVAHLQVVQAWCREIDAPTAVGHYLMPSAWVTATVRSRSARNCSLNSALLGFTGWAPREIRRSLASLDAMALITSSRKSSTKVGRASFRERVSQYVY